MTDLATGVRAIASLARDAAAGTDQAAAVDMVTRRLDEPLRVAIAGRVKAGKSTLLNALVGERQLSNGRCKRRIRRRLTGNLHRDGDEWKRFIKRLDPRRATRYGT